MVFLMVQVILNSQCSIRRVVKILGLLSLLLVAVPINAFEWACVPRGTMSGDFSLLYLRPNSADQLLATAFSQGIDASPSFQQTYRLPTRFAWSYCGALRLDLTCKPFFVRGSFLWSESTHSETKYPPPGGVLYGVPLLLTLPPEISYATGQEKIRYMVADVEGGHLLARYCRLSASIFAGVRYADVRTKHDAQYSSAAMIPVGLRATELFQFHGVGPRVGCELRGTIWRSWALVGRLGSAMLFAVRSLVETHSSSEMTLLTTHVSNQNDLTWAFDGKLGLLFSWRTSCWKFHVEGGMILDHIVQGLQSPQAITSYFAPRLRPFTIGGPYIKIGASF